MEKPTIQQLKGYLDCGVDSRDHSNTIYRNKLTIDNYKNFIGDYADKMILNPLSSLTKEQLKELESIFGDISRLTDTMQVGSFVPNGIVNKLYEWHFDVHGLIEKGLAIDATTLTDSPYLK